MFHMSCHFWISLPVNMLPLPPISLPILLQLVQLLHDHVLPQQLLLQPELYLFPLVQQLLPLLVELYQLLVLNFLQQLHPHLLSSLHFLPPHVPLELLHLLYQFSFFAASAVNLAFESGRGSFARCCASSFFAFIPETPPFSPST